MKTFYQLIKRKSNITIKKYNKLAITLIAIVTVSNLSACAIDRIRSERLFEQYCNEEGRVGQFIYERVALGEEFFVPIPKDPRKINQHFVVGNGMMDKALLEQKYVFSKYSEVKLLSSIGPIYSIETSVIRKSDNKLLGKSVSLNNRKGWLAESNVLGQNEGDKCPREYNKQKESYESSLLHATLIKKIFYRNKYKGIK